MKPMQKLKRVPTTAKVLFTQNGQAYLDELEKRLDTFLEDARSLNEAVWELVTTSKNRAFKALEALVPSNGKESGQFVAVKKAARRVTSSATDLGHEVQVRAKQVRKQAKKVAANGRTSTK